jgi:hypothetical protein
VRAEWNIWFVDTCPHHCIHTHTHTHTHANTQTHTAVSTKTCTTGIDIVLSILNHPITQGSIKLSPMHRMVHWCIGFLFLYKKGSNAKKESYCCTEPYRLDQVYHSNQWTNNKKIKFFKRNNFVLPWITWLPTKISSQELSLHFVFMSSWWVREPHLKEDKSRL